jgi:hypothetical protein
MKWMMSIALGIVSLAAANAATQVGEFNCVDNTGELQQISGKVYGSQDQISSARIRVQKAGEKAVTYVAKPEKSSMLFFKFSSSQHGGLQIEIFGDDMGDMSSIRLQDGRVLSIQCSYNSI